MCNFTAPPPHRPAAQRHRNGTTAAHRRCRTAPEAPPQRPKVSTIRYLCAPNCGIFSGTGTASPRFCPMFTIQIAPTQALHHENQIISATCQMHHFLIPNLHLTLPFSLPSPVLPPLPFPKTPLYASTNLQNLTYTTSFHRNLGNITFSFSEIYGINGTLRLMG